jgi:hypothetical protein
MQIDDDLIRTSLKFQITSLVNALNFLDELDEDEKISLINTQLNIMMNILQPVYAELFLEELLGFTERYKQLEAEETMEQIIYAMRKGGRL